MAHDSTQLKILKMGKFNRSQMQGRHKIRIVAKNLNAAKNLTFANLHDSQVNNSKYFLKIGNFYHSQVQSSQTSGFWLKIKIFTFA